MDIHKPKPFHGWREFLKEYGIIVLGVLTALGAEQVVEWLHWRHAAHDAREAVGADYKRALFWIGETDVAGPCIVARLNQLGSILDQAERVHRLPPLGQTWGPPALPWNLRGWEGVVTSQTLPHLERGEGARFSAIAARSALLAQWRDEESADWGLLKTMAGPGRPLSDVEAAALRRALGDALHQAVRIRAVGDQLGQQIFDTGLLTHAAFVAAWKQGVQMHPKITVCEPLPPPGSVSNEAMRLAAPASPPDQPYDTADSPYRTGRGK